MWCIHEEESEVIWGGSALNGVVMAGVGGVIEVVSTAMIVLKVFEGPASACFVNLMVVSSEQSSRTLPT